MNTTRLVPVTITSKKDLCPGDQIFPNTTLGHRLIKVGVAHRLITVVDHTLHLLIQGVQFKWACEVHHFTVMRPIEEQEETVINNPKIESNMSTTSTTTGFQVMIPEQAIQERVDKLVMYKLRHEKVHGILSEVVQKEREELTQELKRDLLKKVREDYYSKKEKIIESYLESKRVNIMLNGELKAVVDNPNAHKELPKLLSFLQLFKQAMIVGPTGSGKSTLAKQAAESLQLRYGSFSCNMEASKSELVGFANLNGYVTSQFLDFYENGGLFLIDKL